MTLKTKQRRSTLYELDIYKTRQTDDSMASRMFERRPAQVLVRACDSAFQSDPEHTYLTLWSINA